MFLNRLSGIQVSEVEQDKMQSFALLLFAPIGFPLHEFVSLDRGWPRARWSDLACLALALPTCMMLAIDH